MSTQLAPFGLKAWQWKIAAIVIAGGIFYVMAGAIADTPSWDGEGAAPDDDYGNLAEALFSTHVVALEALGILLTAAMIGAMVIARPLGGRADDENYPTKRDRDELGEVQAVSDVDKNLGGSK